MVLNNSANVRPSSLLKEQNNSDASQFYLHVCAHSFSSTLLSSAALQALKRKKRYEKQLAQIDGTLSTIEFQRDALENANTNTEVLKNIGFAAKAMKSAHENL